MCKLLNYFNVLWKKQIKSILSLDQTDLSRVVVPQFLMQPVGMSFLPLDLSNDIKNLGVGAAGAAASFPVWFAVWLTAAVVCEESASPSLIIRTLRASINGAGRQVKLSWSEPFITFSPKWKPLTKQLNQCGLCFPLNVFF